MWALLTLVLCAFPVAAQQVADTAFRPPIEKPAYAQGKGPVVLIDEAHNNFHTASGRYLPFAELLRRDGYVVEASGRPFSGEALGRGKILVIANAVAEESREATTKPPPQAFTPSEIAALKAWVETGGSLLLIADHLPFAGAALDLAKAFGIRFRDGMAGKPETGSGRLVFQRSDGTLRDHAVTKGIDQVATFTGSSFELDVPGMPLLVFGDGVRSWASQDDPNPLPVQGHLQGALLEAGKGRAAVFGEAAMFSAQLAGPNRTPMGMNAPIAKQNAQFVLNVLHWLSGLL